MTETLIRNHEAMEHVTPVVDAFRDSHELDGQIEVLAAERVEDAADMLSTIETAVTADELDDAVAEYMEHTESERAEHPDQLARAVAVGVEEVYAHPADSTRTAAELYESPIKELGDALRDVQTIRGEGAVEAIVELIEAADTKSGIPEFDRLDDYSPEFAGQLLLHRSNAELSADDIILPSDQISAEQHASLNSQRGFTSSSSPTGSGGYDSKLAHVGTRDFGTQYGKYLYIVEPLEGDTLKWGENFGADVSRGRKVTSRAIDTAKDQFATTDSYTGKLHHEVVSTKGFRVVEKVPHEPAYDEAMLPWPVSQQSIDTHRARKQNKISNVAPRGSDTEPGFGPAYTVRTESRKKPGTLGPVDSPGTYRAYGQRNPAEWRGRFDALKHQAEYPGQPSLPGVTMSKYGAADRWAAQTLPRPESPAHDQKDTPLPGMDDMEPIRPPQF